MRSAPLPTKADVVVIGGGVMGTSILFHLAEAGVSDAVLVERGQLGSGSSSKAAGGVRTQFSDELNVRLAQRSLTAFEDFGRRPGWEIDLKQVGYLFLLTREDDMRAFGAGVELQNGLGVPSRMLTPAEAREVCPLIDPAGLLGAAFCASDGHLTPEAVVAGYAFAARASGAHIQTRCQATGLRPGLVQTDHGDIEAETVICAAGAWSAEVGRMAGVHLPVTPLRRQIVFTEPIGGLPDHLPMTIDFASSFYFHREGPGLLMGMSFAGQEPGFSTEQSDDWLPGLQEALERVAPSVAGAGIKGGWGGLYEVSPDSNALIGRAGDFLYATGFSGHGFLQAPAVGEVVRDLYLGREPFVDVSAFGADRFDAGRERPERNVV